MEPKKVQSVNQVEVKCVVCETIDHVTNECPTLLAFKEVLYGQTNNNHSHNFKGRQKWNLLWEQS